MKIQAQLLGECNLLLRANKRDGELHGTRIDFSKAGHEIDGTEYLQGLGYVG